MRLWLKRQSSKVYHRIREAIESEVRLAQAELKKYEGTITLFGVGVFCLILGRFSGIVYIELAGALAMCYALLKGVDK